MDQKLFGDILYGIDTNLFYEDINFEAHNFEFLVRLGK